MLEVEHLAFSYGKEAVLSGVSFTARPGEVTVLVGANGAGKTTLLKCLAEGKPPAGGICFEGRDIREISREEYSRAVSFLEQSTVCEAALNVFEVILLGRLNRLSYRVSGEDLAQVEKVMELLEISRFSGRNIAELSGGQRQLVFIAQALVKEPRLLLLDEPTSALDLHHQFKLMDFLRKMTKDRGYTTVITLHHLDIAAKYADHMVALNAGGVYREGRPEEVFSEALLREVYQVEAEIHFDAEKKKHVIPVGFIGE